MTDLLTRKTKLVIQTPIEEQGREIVVEVKPWGLELRRKGTRTRYSVDFSSIYWLAVKKEVDKQRAEKKAQKKGKR